MLSLKLQEMEDEYVTDKTEHDDTAYSVKQAAKLTKFKAVDEDGFGKFDTEENTGFNSNMFEKALDEEDEMNEVDLEELLAELNEEDEMEESLYEAEEGEDEMSDEEAEEEGEPLDLEDMTDEDLKDMIEDVIKNMVASGELEAGHEGEGEKEEGGEEMEMSDEEEVDLAELLREIEEMEDPMYEEKEEVDEIFGMFKKGSGGSKFVQDFIKANQSEIDKLGSIEDKAAKLNAAKPLIAKFYNENVRKMDAGALRSDTSVLRDLIGVGELGGGSKSVVSTAEAMDSELKEAYSTIKTLKNELNEINLLNAKLLYSNKIFKAKNLNESQKVKVLSSFDKANTVGEVKMVFETLNEGIKVAKTTIKENLGSASKLTSTPTAKKPIVESNDAFLRMQKLAGLI
jgi:hypothetical protein